MAFRMRRQMGEAWVPETDFRDRWEVMQGTHLPLRKWFLAAYLMATHSNSISALQLQPKLGASYKTAWLVLHKLRRAMVNPNRTPLSGTVDVDESAIPYRRKEDALERGGGSSTANQIWIAGAVETVGNHGVGRIRLARIADRSAQSIVPFVVANTLPGSAVRTDSLASYHKVPGRRLRQVNLSNRTMPAHTVFKWIHVVFANLKRWALGTFHGFREKHLDAYLGEFAFRWNRRRHFHSAMDTMLGVGQRIAPVTHRGIVGDTTQWKKEHILQPPASRLTPILDRFGNQLVQAVRGRMPSPPSRRMKVLTRSTCNYNRCVSVPEA